MRQFATTMNITDLQGYPITGDRLAFYVKENNSNTEVLATIYDASGVAIDNPVKVVNGKTAKQVFLGNETVKVVHQTCTDEENDVWVNVETWVDIPGHYDVTVEGGRPAVANLTALKAADTELGSVILEGYNEAGDCSAVTYVWNATCTETADNGTYVASNSTLTGRWVAVWESEAVDVRHYGIFPTIDKTGSQHAAIASAYNKLTAIGKVLYFPVVGNKVYYGLGSDHIEKAIFDGGVIVYTMAGRAELVDCSNVKASTYTNGGVIQITGNDLSTSQNYDNTESVVLVPRKSITFDSDYSVETRWNKLDVILNVQQTHRQIFDTCTFSGSANFNSQTAIFKFISCNIRQSVFANTTNFDRIQFTNCVSSISLWTNFNWYVKFVQKNGSYEADLDGRTVTNQLDISGDLKIKNGVIDILNITGGNVTLENVTVNKVFGCSCVSLALKNVTVVDQEAIGGADLEATDKVYASQSTIGCDIETAVVEMNGTTCNGVYGNKVSAVNCVFNSGLVELEQKNGNVEDCIVSGCVFNGGSYVKLETQVDNVILDGVYIVNNVFNGTARLAFITYGHVNEDDSNFVVSNNTNTLVSTERSEADISTFGYVKASQILSEGASWFKDVQRLNLHVLTNAQLAYSTWTEGELCLVMNATATEQVYSNARVYVQSGIGSDTAAGWVQLKLPPYGAALLIYHNGWIVGGPQIRSSLT